MAITNLSKTRSLTWDEWLATWNEETYTWDGLAGYGSPFINVSKVSSGETWSSILTTWATETQTWQETGSLLTNASKVQTTDWDDLTSPWSSYSEAWATLGGSNMSNVSKP